MKSTRILSYLVYKTNFIKYLQKSNSHFFTVYCNLYNKTTNHIHERSENMGILVKLVEALFSKNVNQTQKIQQYSKASKNPVTCKIYSVKGKNPDTGRIKTNRVVVEVNESIENIQQKSGLLPPFEMAEIIPDKVTEKQAAYAKSIGLVLPVDATKEDASIFLSRYENDKPLFPPPMPQKILHYLIGKGIFVPAYASMDEAHNLYFNNIELTEQIAYFGMKVYCNLKRKKYCLLDDVEPEQRDLFNEFAKQFIKNDEFLKSLSHYSGNDLPLDSFSITKKLKAYDLAIDFFVK